MVNRILDFRGERFIHSTSDNLLKFQVREPFYSAGKQFGWQGVTVGLGISEEALEYALQHNCRIQVRVGEKKDRAYEIAAQAWKAFAEKNGSIMKCKDTKIYVIQWSRDHFKTVRIKETTK